jgi:hypothetical protein
MKRNVVITTLFSIVLLLLCSSFAFALEADALVGKWHTEKNTIFVDLDLKADGTGHFVNYAGKASDGKWTLEDNYLRFEAGGETSGGIAKMEGEILKVEWVADYTRVK